jgi:hypothetical protein
MDAEFNIGCRAKVPVPVGHGHILAETLDQATSDSGVAPERIYVDKGCRGHNCTGAGEVMIAGRRRGLTPPMRRELRRRSAIEAAIGHMKTDGRLDRNFLLAGDTPALPLMGYWQRVVMGISWRSSPGRFSLGDIKPSRQR